jgi:hypothetical protein
VPIVVPTPDQPTLDRAIERLAGLDLLDRARAARRRGDGPPSLTFSELLAYVHGRAPARDARVQDAIRRNAGLRRRYQALLRDQTAATLPALRAAASTTVELRRSFEIDGKRGEVTVKPLTVKPGHVLLAIAFAAPPRLRSLDVAVPEGHPRTAEFAGLRLRLAERAAATVELVLPSDDPIIAALLDPDVTIAVTTLAP